MHKKKDNANKKNVYDNFLNLYNNIFINNFIQIFYFLINKRLKMNNFFIYNII